MKTEKQIIAQRDELQKQLDNIMGKVKELDAASIETKSIYGWAKCIESGIEALDWVLADDSYVNIVY